MSIIHEREAKLTALDASIARGLADIDTGKPARQIRFHPPPSPRNYPIFCRIEKERVALVHVRHGAMDYLGLLFEH